jgi:hypothetical protein
VRLRGQEKRQQKGQQQEQAGKAADANHGRYYTMEIHITGANVRSPKNG